MDKRSSPIFSTRESDTDAREALDAFVVGLAECVDELQDAESQADLELLGSLCEKLAREAAELGYRGLEEPARGVVKACLEEKADVAQQALLEVTDVAQRVRLGHRGSA